MRKFMNNNEEQMAKYCADHSWKSKLKVMPIFFFLL
jgi:hypothetical protein